MSSYRSKSLFRYFKTLKSRFVVKRPGEKASLSRVFKAQLHQLVVNSLLAFFAILLIFNFQTSPVAKAGNFVTITNCSDFSALQNAVQTGGTINFGCDGTIPFTSTSPLIITNNVTLDATGHNVILDGNNNVQLFNVAPVGNLTLNHLTLQNGKANSGGAVSSSGTLTIINSGFNSNKVVGSAGDPGSGLDITRCGVQATGNGQGGTGGDTSGGAIASLGGTLTISNSTFQNNTAQGGSGGPGQSPTISCSSGNSSSINGGYGGKGGNSYGGAIYISSSVGQINLNNNFFFNNLANGGDGGKGGNGSSDSSCCGGNGGNGGIGGAGIGGTLYSSASNAIITGNYFAYNQAQGGKGGSGGNGGNAGAATPHAGAGGNGGNGSYGAGGAVHIENGANVTVSQNGLGNNLALFGSGGAGGSAGSSDKSVGTPGNGGAIGSSQSGRGLGQDGNTFDVQNTPSNALNFEKNIVTTNLNSPISNSDNINCVGISASSNILEYPAATCGNGATITPNLFPFTTTLSVQPVNGMAGSPVQLNATLKTLVSPISNQTVSFTLNGGSSTTGTTNSNGIATVTQHIPNSPGSFPGGVNASYAGSSYSGQTIFKDTSKSTDLTITIPNNTWANAIELSSSTNTYTDSIFESNGARWYKFTAGPNSQVQITLTGANGATALPANYDLSFHNDISKTYQNLVNLQSSAIGSSQSSSTVSLPLYSTPLYSTPLYSTPLYSTPLYSTPLYSTPLYSTPLYSTPLYSTPLYSTPLYSTYDPSTGLPVNYLSEAFRLDTAVPTSYQSQAYSSAVLNSLIAVAAQPGLAPEVIQRNTWSSSGTFYVRVQDMSGTPNSNSTPFTLNVAVTVSACSVLSNYTSPGSTYTANSNSYKTIILTDSARLPGDAVEKSVLFDKLTSFANRSEISGVVVDLSQPQYTGVNHANQFADQNTGCPLAKNLVAGEIKNIIDAYRAKNSSLQYIVIAGADNVIPFFRYPDQAEISNEKEYNPALISGGPQDAALRLNYTLGQDYFGSSQQLAESDHSFPLPDLPVGRLVETPTDISGMLDAYTGANGVITPQSSLVTGYDFLYNVSTNLTGEFKNATGNPSDSLLSAPGASNLWTADQLRSTFLGSKHDLVFLGGHFSSGATLAADNNTRMYASELAASPVDMTNALVLSVGCHSGYNIDSADEITGVTDQPDWPQSFAQKKMTAVLGTGFQYADNEVIAYSAKLMQELSVQLHTRQTAGATTVPIGAALMKAKQRYLATTNTLPGTNEKVLLESTLFGLPMLQLQYKNNLLDPLNDNPVISATQPVSGAGQTLGLSTTDYTLTSSPKLNNVTVTNNGKTTVYSYYSGTDGVVANAYNPLLPLEQRNVSVQNQVLRGIGFRGGNYQDLNGVQPQTSVPSTEQGQAPTLFSTNVFYPVQPFTANFETNASGVTTRLSGLPSQYISASSNSITGTLRSYQAMNFKLFYIGSNSTAGALLAPAPAIRGIIAKKDGQGNLVFSGQVQVDPSAGLQAVWVTYTSANPADSLYGHWASTDLTFTQDANDTTLWNVSGSMALPSNSSDFRFILQAASGAGLVTLSSNAGAYYHITVPTTANPSPISTTLTPTFPSQTFTFQDNPTFTVKLNSDSGPVANQPVSFSLNGLKLKANTASDGIAGVQIPLNIAPGKYYLNYSYAGSDDGTLLPAFATEQITIIPRGTNLAINTESGGSVVVTLTTAVQGTPLAQKTIFFIGTNGSTSFAASSLTDVYGRALLGHPLWPAGSYSIKAYYLGSVPAPVNSTFSDSFYDSSTGEGASFNVVNPVPVAQRLNPSTTVKNSATATISVLGYFIVPGATATWTYNGVSTPLTSAYISGQELSVVVPASLLQNPGVALITITNPATGGGPSLQALPFYITDQVTTVQSSAITSGSGVITASTGGAGLGTPGSLTIVGNATSPGQVSVAIFGSNPAGAFSNPPNPVFVDARISPYQNFSSVTLVDCNLKGGSALYFWNIQAQLWQLASNQVFSAQPTPCVTVTVNNTTVPNLSQLVGTYFVSSNSTPVVNSVTSNQGSTIISTTVPVTATFTDPGVGETHSASINWGDGSPAMIGTVTESTTPNGTGLVTASHVYTKTGVFEISVNVTDSFGTSGANSFDYVVIYDPNGSFVTGGGWINSPQNAYPAGPGLTGKANFGFNVNYQKNSKPTGDLNFNFKPGNLDFKSTGFNSLVISGAKAQLKGTGTNNKVTGYTFILTVIDGKQAVDKINRFRIQIWAPDGKTLIYDNQPGVPSNADPTTPLGGGNIVVHS